MNFCFLFNSTRPRLYLQYWASNFFFWHKNSFFGRKNQAENYEYGTAETKLCYNIPVVYNWNEFLFLVQFNPVAIVFAILSFLT